MAHHERPCARPPYHGRARARVHTATGVHSRDRRAGLSAALNENFITAGDPRAVANICDYSRPEDRVEEQPIGADRVIG